MTSGLKKTTANQAVEADGGKALYIASKVLFPPPLTAIVRQNEPCYQRLNLIMTRSPLSLDPSFGSIASALY